MIHVENKAVNSQLRTLCLRELRQVGGNLGGGFIKYDNDVERKLVIEGPYGFEGLSAVESILHAQRPHDLIQDPHRWGSGVSIVPPTGFIGAHVDYARHPKIDAERALNVIVFLHNHWEKGWGGELVLMDPKGAIQKIVEPEPGRMVMWEPGDGLHRVETVKGPENRISMSTYFLREPCPPDRVRTRALFVPNRMR